MVEHQPSKLDTWVRFPSPAFLFFKGRIETIGNIELKNGRDDKQVQVTEKKYTFNELKKGMKVLKSQLSNILDTPMILIDTKVIGNYEDFEGTLAYFGEANEEYESWFHQEKPITPIYFDSEELEDNVVYDE